MYMYVSMFNISTFDVHVGTVFWWWVGVLHEEALQKFWGLYSICMYKRVSIVIHCLSLSIVIRRVSYPEPTLNEAILYV